ncbi:hypothetical protein BJ912DRAFT_950949 [Pholiota molesta]|nr:hypothetical protein BJ912DRAFT_950949 [Pholiota molesta]
MQAAFVRCLRYSQVSRNRTTCLVPEVQQRRVVNSHAPVKDTKRYSSSKSTSAKPEQLHARRQQLPKQPPVPSNKARTNSSPKPKSEKLEPKPETKPKPEPEPRPEKMVFIHSETPTVKNSRFDFNQPNPRKKPRSSIPVMEGDAFPTDTAVGLSDLLKNKPAHDAKALFGILAGWLLRHEARNMGYAVAPDCFVRVSDVLRFPPFSAYSIAEFGRLIETDAKDRFEIARLPDFIEGVLKDAWWVRARHMHSIPGISPHNKRILKTEKLQMVEYRTRPENWNYILLSVIPTYLPQFNKHALRTHPYQTKILSVTIDCQKAVQMGVMFYYTTDVTLYAVGTPDKGVIPFEACRSAVILDVSKDTLK